ncbi:sacsin N-terminal ATP-binding-like domain-containing protein [Phytoactinopolyspora halotolerans]|uniref:sacsin N-terminal ATP-binding-like domain-containing protein n=1 Tax=Phytoactinopolyspora halotolerans TaxID=1981512 RepID=UPI001C2083AD|nr:hypothetical protein [Phytoactinopolyspora halotolerans]
MDTFSTAAIRTRVLAAWSASPARFREDANAEEELVLGAYRDRLVVELAQNAADAATRAGTSGRLLLRLEGHTLLAANTGAPLDAAGVEGLSTLRASAKPAPDRESGDGRDRTVGRFGVGFAAVLAVSDEPTVHSRSGGVRWSRAEARELASAVPELAGELDRRGSAVPVLRLPFPAAGADAPALPDGYDTAVVLPLRDEQAVTVTRRLLAAVDDALLLVLPALREVIVDIDGERQALNASPPLAVDPDAGLWERQVGPRRWRLAQLSGRADASLLADRPVDERLHPAWSVTVAIPVDEAPTDPLGIPPADAGSDAADVIHPAALPESVPNVAHAPTPTDDRIDLPALVIADFPLDSTRRHVAPGPYTDHLVDQVAAAYARLTASFETPAALTLVPGPFGAGELDAALHRAIQRSLARTAFVPSAHGPLRPVEVVLVDGLERAGNPQALAPFVAGLPAPGWGRRDVLSRLGARTLPLADLIDELSAAQLAPEQWRELYAALDGAGLEALGALPVPLADGRVVRGPRGVLLPEQADAELLRLFGLRVAHPEAVHPLLRRLGAVEADPSAVLADPAVRNAVANADDESAERLAEAVLALVAAADASHQELPWLAELPLPDATGSLVPAGELFLPGTDMVNLLDVDPAEYTTDAGVLEQHGPDVLKSVGVRTGFAVLRDSDVPLDDDIWHDLDDEDQWAATVLATLPETAVPPLLSEFIAVRDLDLIRADAWTTVLGRLAESPDTRAAVVDPVFAVLADGSRRAVESYTAWWLRTHVRLDGYRLDELCAPDAAPITRALLHPLPPRAASAADHEFVTALGVARSVRDVALDTLLDRLGDESTTLTSHQLMEIYAELDLRASETSVPDAFSAAVSKVRVPDGVGTRLVDAADAVVCSGPHWLQLGLPAVIPGSPALADLLDVDLAEEAYDAVPVGDGDRLAVPDVARDVLGEVTDSYVEHDELSVAGVPVDWWLDGETVHAATLDGLARGLAWAAGAWHRRWVLAEALAEPDALPSLLADEAFSDR